VKEFVLSKEVQKLLVIYGESGCGKSSIMAKIAEQIETTNNALNYLYSRLSERHGTVLFQRAMEYIHIFQGITENELEDILSSDDQVLQSIFVHYLPPIEIFRLPGTLWTRIKNDMKNYLVEKEIDGLTCIYFYHRSFFEYIPCMQDIYSQLEILEKNRLNYFFGLYQPPNQKSYELSKKLQQKYHYSSNTIQTNRRLSVMQPFRKRVKKGEQFNYRRLKQLTEGTERYDYMHPSTLYNYEFMLCYLKTGLKIKLLLEKFSNFKQFYRPGEFQFLFKLYEMLQSILDRYPSNFAFEISSRLERFRELPSNLMSLQQQCSEHSVLRSLQSSSCVEPLHRCQFNSNIHCIAIEDEHLYILTDSQLVVALAKYYLTDYTWKWNLPSLTSAYKSIVHYYTFFICVYTSNSFLVYDYHRTEPICFHQEEEINKDNEYLIVDTVGFETILCCKRNGTLFIWNFVQNQLKHTIELNQQISNCTICRSKLRENAGDTNTYTLLKIYPAKSNELHYLVIITMDPTILKVVWIGKIELQQSVKNMSIDIDLLNVCTDVQYHKEKHQLHFYQIPYIDKEKLLPTDQIEFDFRQTQLSKSIYLSLNELSSIDRADLKLLPQSHFLEKPLLCAITNESVQIIHSCECEQLSNFKFDRQPEYKYNYLTIPTHCHYGSAVSAHFGYKEYNYLLCWNSSGLIDIYKWKCDYNHVHSYSALIHLDVYNRTIMNVIFSIDWTNGITVYVSLADGELQKYNVAFSLLCKQKSFIKNDSDRTKISQLYVECGHIVTLNEAKKYVTL
ncbi:unnamed protein product, partial [Didymodactylos carnosus]